jgi:hypothetical protein
MDIRREFEKIPEFRTGDIEIGIPDALMSAFAMFSLKDSSLLQFDERRKDDAECQNLESVYGVKNIPSDSRMREICDEIDPKKYLAPIFKVPFRHLQRGNDLKPMVFYKGCYLLNLDGTGFFSSKKISAPYCATASIYSWNFQPIDIISRISQTSSQLYQNSIPNSCHDPANSLIFL